MVKKCDFLEVEIKDEIKDNEDKTLIEQLQPISFDIVVFSFFLEYIPSPEQRFICCKKAYQLLKQNGLLCIVTPDSKHQNANVHLYKLWKITLEFMGFNRIKYEKMTHFHGMVFRKGINQSAWQTDASRELEFIKRKNVKEKFKSIDLDSIKSKIFIPQDFQDIDKNDKN